MVVGPSCLFEWKLNCEKEWKHIGRTSERHGNGHQADILGVRLHALTIRIVGPFLPLRICGEAVVLSHAGVIVQLLS